MTIRNVALIQNVAEAPVALADLVDARDDDHDERRRGEPLVDRHLQPVHVGQVLRVELLRDREHDRLREGGAEADDDRGDVDEDGDAVGGDRGEQHPRDPTGRALPAGRLRTALPRRS